MKYRRLAPFVLIICVLPFASCASCKPGSFTIERKSAESVVDGSPSVLGLPVVNVLPPMKIDFDLQQELESHDAKGAKSVFLQDLTLKITDTKQPDGDTDNFDFLDHVDVYIESTKDGTDLEKVKIASLADIPSGSQTATFAVEQDVDLKPYIEEGVRLTTKGQGQAPEDDTSLLADVTVLVKVL